MSLSCIAVLFGVVYLVVSYSPVSALGPFWLTVIAFSVAAISNVTIAVERLLLVTAVILGVIPLFGWLALPAWFNPLNVVLAIYVVDMWWNAELVRARPVLNTFSTAPPLIVGIFTYQWWCGLSKGTPAAVLERLLPIWDLSAHFNFFYSNLATGVYLPRASTGDLTTEWFGREYPSGVHYIMSLYAREQRDKLSLSPEAAIPIFANSIVILLAVSVFICAICGWRLGKTRIEQFSFSAATAGLSCALISVGPMSQTISTGFANMPAVVIPLVILISIHLRPLQNSSLQTLALASCVGAIAYNWYPALFLVSPLIIFQILKTESKKRNLKIIALSLVMMALCVPPIIQTLSLGISHIYMSGGIQPFPSGLLVVLVLLSCSIAVGALALPKDRYSYFSLNVVPFPLTIVFVVWLHIRTQQYNYYFHKYMLITATFAIFAILFSVLHYVSVNEISVRLNNAKHSTPIVLSSLILGLGLSQTCGYWGPDYPSFSGTSSAVGLLTRNEITKRSHNYMTQAEGIVQLTRTTKNIDPKERECILLFVPLQSENSSTDVNGPAVSLLTNVWYHSLSRTNTEKSQIISSVAVNLTSSADESEVAASIVRTYNPDSVCIYTTDDIVKALNSTKTYWKLRRL